MDIKLFKRFDNMFDNLTREVEVKKYTDSDSATDLKQMKESYVQLCHEHIHYGSKNIQKRLDGMKIIYQLTLFLNENVKKFHIFDYNSDGSNAYSSHKTWDDIINIQRQLEDVFELKKDDYSEELKLIENVYENIKNTPDIDYKSQNIDKYLFFGLLHFFRIFEGWYSHVIVDDFHARSKKQIYDCQCKADKEAIKDLSKQTNKDVAKMILKVNGGANNKRDNLSW